MKSIKLYFPAKRAGEKTARKKILETCLLNYDVTKNYAGFQSRPKLAHFLEQQIFGFNDNDKLKNKKMDPREISQLINQTIKKCQQKAPAFYKLSIHCFPSYNQFTNKLMHGISGYTPDQKNILLFISAEPGWKKQLRHTVAHEYAHAVSFKYYTCRTVLDSLVFEGIAEHFREAAIGGEKSDWVKALSPQKSRALFKKINGKLQSTREREYQELFLGTNKKYPLWAGYAIGYEIVQSFLKNNPKIPWLKIMQQKPKNIFLKSNYK